LDIGAIWDLIILSPMINIMVVLTKYLFSNLGLTIIALTIIIRAAMYPLSRRQLLSSKKMQDLQPKLVELQKKYAKDRQKLAKEQMALYKEAGVSPTGCLLPMVVQMPVWIALYQSIMRVLATTPEELLNLSRHLYTSWSLVFDQVPLNSRFLWLDLGASDTYIILPILVGVTMWIQQKMTTPTYTDPQQQSQGQMMLWMMPLLFAFMSLQFSSGLALYWLTSNVISIVMQYFISGWGPLATMFKRQPATKSPAKPRSGAGQVSQKKEVATTKKPTLGKEKKSWMFWK
jgi:YidC/Oxa1 family membrane protein insertase